MLRLGTGCGTFGDVACNTRGSLFEPRHRHFLFPVDYFEKTKIKKKGAGFIYFKKFQIIYLNSETANMFKQKVCF